MVCIISISVWKNEKLVIAQIAHCKLVSSYTYLPIASFVDLSFAHDGKCTIDEYGFFSVIVNAIAFIYLFCKTLTLNISNENLKRLVCQRYGSFLWGTPLQPKILNTHRWRKRWFLICLVKYIVYICSLQVVNLFILVGIKGKQFIFFYKRLRIWN